jgi:hypothetical protein
MKPYFSAAFAAALLFAAAYAGADSDDHASAAVAAPSRVSRTGGETVITLDAAARAKSGIETAPGEPRPFRRELHGYAKVLDAGPLGALRGRYQAAAARLAAARAKLQASQSAYRRAQGLYRDGRNASLAEVQAAEAAYHADRAGLAAARAARSSLATEARQEWGAALGRAVAAGGPLLQRLMQRRALLVQVTLPPGGALAEAPARAALETDRGERARLEFVSGAPRTDPKIQGASFYYTVPAASGVLPGMELLARLPAGKPLPAVRVPAQAVVWWQDRAWIYRRTGPDTFTRVPIATDRPARGGGYLVAGLPEGSEIVTRGAQLLLSEEFRAQIQVGD